jgi:serine carboxypeptidase-like clade 2
MTSSQTAKILLAVALLTAVALAWTPEAENDKVAQLDQYPIKDFELFSGYLVLQQQPLINVHYVFMTATSEYATRDLVMWLNGGPGCSSMLGWTQEIGPRLLLSGSSQFSASSNPYSWNKLANLLFFESPPGVGFSINNDPNYIYNESRTATDNVAALKLWFERFPEMKANNFWITGESYCGMYIPNYASALIDANKNQDIKFKGVMIGNGVMVTEQYWRRNARNKFYSKHYFYGPETDALI